MSSAQPDHPREADSAQPVVSGDLVILGVSNDSADAHTGTTLGAYDAATGDLEWQIPLPDTEGIAASGGLVFYLDGTQVVAFDATTGETRYRAGAFMPVGDVTADQSRVYVSLWHGAAAFDAQDGSQDWWWQQDVGLVNQP